MPEYRERGEQRKSVRQASILPVRLELPSAGGQHFASTDGETRDLSNQGAYFWAQGAFSIGQQVRLRLEVPPGHGHNYRMEVLWDAQVIRVEALRPGQRKSAGAGTLGVAVKVIRGEPPKVIREAPRWAH